MTDTIPRIPLVTVQVRELDDASAHWDAAAAATLARDDAAYRRHMDAFWSIAGSWSVIRDTDPETGRERVQL